MTLRKNDIELLNKISDGQFEDLGSKPEDIALFEQILNQSSSWSIDSNIAEEDSFQNVLDKINKEKVVESNGRVFEFIKIAAAISVLLISSFLVYQFLNTNRIEAELAEIKTIYLPDSSKVILNAGSQMSYSVSDWKKGNRKLKLEGQAYFEVKKGSKFSVKSSQGMVSVLGTSFNIYDRGEDYRVECFSGKVSVETEDSKNKIYLTKGLKTQLRKEASDYLEIPAKFNEAKSIEWTSGVFNFYNSPLEEVFAELERQYNIKVQYNRVSDKFYTGTFDKNDIKKSIINICKPMGCDFEFKENNLVIIDN